jgi:hypothetical protein
LASKDNRLKSSYPVNAWSLNIDWTAKRPFQPFDQAALRFDRSPDALTYVFVNGVHSSQRADASLESKLTSTSVSKGGRSAPDLH